MAFYITKKPGHPDLTILTDGGSLQIGEGLLVENGELKSIGGGGTTVSFRDILGEPTDNLKLAAALGDYIHKNGTTETLDAKQINFYSTDEDSTRTIGSIYARGSDLDSPIHIESRNGIEFKDLTNNTLAFNLPSVAYNDGVETLRTTWPEIINTANGESDVYAKATDITQLTQKIEDNELVISSALNDLNDRLLNVYNREESEEEFTTKVEFREATAVTAASLNDLNERKIDASKVYTKEEINEMIQNLINTYHSE